MSTQLEFLKQLIEKEVAQHGEDDPIVKLFRQQQAEMEAELDQPDPDQIFFTRVKAK